MKKLRIRKSDIGRWATVKWDCIGRQDCLLVDVELEELRPNVRKFIAKDSGYPEQKQFKFDLESSVSI